MSKYTIVISCSSKAYDEINSFLMNSAHELPSRKFKIFENGYFYYHIESVDGFIVETLNALIGEIKRLNDAGEYAVLRNLD
ncbi:hypothetical protein WH243_14645 [Acinetobacter sp. MYb177]|uniref:hypothetical protein n=1 Tax=unclassified Acinetobacter TaxID=196816 RepID=UPI0030A6DF9F